MFYEIPTSTGNVFIDVNHVSFFSIEEDGSVTLNFVGDTTLNTPMANWATCLAATNRDGMSYSRVDMPIEGDVNDTEYVDATTDGLGEPGEDFVEVQGYGTQHDDGHPELEPEQFQEVVDEDK